MYGATEAAARLTYLPSADLSRKLGSIGRAIPNVEIRVVTEDGRMAAVGEIGELVARGANISSGYWTARTNPPHALVSRATVPGTWATPTTKASCFWSAASTT